MLDEFSKGQQVKDLKSMREFLEGAYAIAISNTNVVDANNNKNSVCYQISILGNYIPPILGGILNQTMDDLFKTYGPPPPQPFGLAVGPQEVPLLTSTQDYIVLLQLCIASKNLSIFSSGTFPLWKSDLVVDSSGNSKTVKTDICFNQNANNTSIVNYAKDLYSIVKSSLEHFHNQITITSTVTKGDTSDTKAYHEGMQDYYSDYIIPSCIAGKKSICSEKPQASEYYSYYKGITFTDFPNAGTYNLRSYIPSDTTKFRVLVIAGGGGGGGGASGKYNNNGSDQTGGGGGGGGGGGISLSGIYPYTNNYQIVVGQGGTGGSRVNANKNGTNGKPGNKGGSSYLYDIANKQTIVSANGGNGGGGGFVANGNSGGSGFHDVGNQGSAGSGGTGISNNGNSGTGSAYETSNGGTFGSSIQWSSPNDTIINPLNGGSGGTCPKAASNNGGNTPGNGGANGDNGFVRVYWIP